MKKFKKIIIPILIIAMFFCVIPKTMLATNVTYKIGDISGDGIIDSRDTLRILEHIAASTIPKINKSHPNWILKDNQLKAADINGDGVIDSRDTLRELEYIAASTIPKIFNKHPEWKNNIESKWEVKATGITINNTNITLEKGKSAKLIATISPTNVTNKIVKWTSSSTKVATVDGLGNIKSTGDGIAIITATTSNGKKATCRVEVKNVTIAAKNITLKEKDSTIAVGSSLKLNATITPTNATNKKITWSSSDSKIAQVTNTGIVKGLKIGKVTITARTSNNIKTTCIIRVNIPAKSISLNKSTITIGKGISEKLTVIFNPTNTSSKEIKWESLNSSIASVNNSGVVTAKNIGTTIIKATSKYGKVTTCKVIVKQLNIEDEKIKVNGRTITKAQYANFRNVSGGKLGKNALYRSINPIHGSSKYAQAAYYADQMLKEHNVKAVLNLDNDSSSIRKSSYSKSTYYRSLFNSGKVCARAISGVKEGKDWQRGIVDRIKFFAKNEGPYEVHCWIGRDRTGFTILLLECLMDVPFENMYNDYKKSDENFRISGRFNQNTTSGFSKDLKIITGKSAADKKHPKASDWKNVNFAKCAENYLRGGGMSNSEIQKLKNNLAKNY